MGRSAGSQDDRTRMRRADRRPLGPPVPSLVAWGLSVDADLIYRCLLMSGARTAGQLERDLGVVWHRVERGLEELLAAGAAGRRADGRRAARWVAVAPEVVLGVLRERLCPPGRRSMEIPRLSPGSVRLGDGLRHLPSRELSRARLADLVRVVRHEHLAIQPDRAYEAESARPAVPMDRALLAAGVRMRVLGALPAGAGDPLVAYGRRADEPRPDYRQAAERPTRLLVMDRRTALLPVSPDDLDRGYLEVTDEAVVAALVAVFERQWAAAARTGQEHHVPRITLTDRERTLLALLARGDTDENAARVMRVSRRTVTATVRDLMDRLGVENRFQLGVAVGAQHLIEQLDEEC